MEARNSSVGGNRPAGSQKWIHMAPFRIPAVARTVVSNLVTVFMEVEPMTFNAYFVLLMKWYQIDLAQPQQIFFKYLSLTLTILRQHLIESIFSELN